MNYFTALIVGAALDNIEHTKLRKDGQPLQQQNAKEISQTKQEEVKRC